MNSFAIEAFVMEEKEDRRILVNVPRIPSNKCSAQEFLQKDNSVEPLIFKELNGDSEDCNPFGIFTPKGIRLITFELLCVRTLSCVCMLFISSNIVFIIAGKGMSYRQTDICNIALLISKGVFSSESRDTHASCFNVLQAPRQAKNSFCVVCNPSNATKRNVCRAALSCALQ